MPPPVSDDESMSDGEDVVPARTVKKAEPVKAKEEEDDSEDEGDDEYVVEELLAHDYMDNGALHYHVKWKGYEADEDRTWEPLENLEDAPEVVEAYHNRIGGAPAPTKPKASAKKGGKGKGGKRSASDAFQKDSPVPAAKKGKATTNGATPAPAAVQRKLPEGSWETDVLRVGSILQDERPAAKPKINKQTVIELQGLLEWNDGGKTQHPLRTLRTKCPQKLLDYYEQHLKFEPILPETEAELRGQSL